MVLVTSIIILLGVDSAAAAERLQSCHSCTSRTANSQCHLRPLRKPAMTVWCAERTAHCVIERLQDEDGTFISIERRCSSLEETKQAHNRCERTTSGTRCVTLCYGNYCNDGTGQLSQDGLSWDYDEPEYSDYIYDPEDAVLSNRKRPYSGPFPVGTEEFPVARTVALVDLVGGAALVTPPSLMVMTVMVLAVLW